MTLTVGSGSLAGRPQHQTNFTLDGPKHRLVLEPYPQRLRAVVAGRVVLDSARAAILHETGHQIVPYAPIEDFDATVLERSDTMTHCPFKGDASYWSIRIGEWLVEDAIWAYSATAASTQRRHHGQVYLPGFSADRAHFEQARPAGKDVVAPPR